MKSHAASNHCLSLNTYIFVSCQQIKELNLSNNYLGRAGVLFLSTCFHNVEVLHLYDCNLSDGDLEIILQHSDQLKKPVSCVP